MPANPAARPRDCRRPVRNTQWMADHERRHGRHLSLTARLLLSAGAGVAALALLSGCTPAEEPQGTGATTPTAPASSPETDASEVDPAGDINDPVYDAISAVNEQYPDGFIVEIDRDDADEVYAMDVVDADRLLQLHVALDGSVTEDAEDSEGEDGDHENALRRASEATISAEAAVRRALEGRSAEQTVDDVDLGDEEGEDGALAWSVDFDDDQGQDADEVVIDALDGRVIHDSAL